MGYLEANPSFTLTYSRGGPPRSTDLPTQTGEIASGLMARFNETIVLWRSKMQNLKTISLSTAEAEYYAASDMAIEVIYLRNLLESMGFPQAPDTPVYEDNTACIEWGNHVIGGRERAKHIDLRKHFAHETIQNRMMSLINIDTSKHLADIFTTPLAYAQFIGCVSGILGEPDAMRQTKVHALQSRLLATPEGEFAQIAFCGLDD
jgi:hypothetical protein